MEILEKRRTFMSSLHLLSPRLYQSKWDMSTFICFHYLKQLRRQKPNALTSPTPTPPPAVQPQTSGKSKAIPIEWCVSLICPWSFQLTAVSPSQVVEGTQAQCDFLKGLSDEEDYKELLACIDKFSVRIIFHVP
jgi:hypothetical protein